jgi:hypothetical protein
MSLPKHLIARIELFNSLYVMIHVTRMLVLGVLSAVDASVPPRFISRNYILWKAASIGKLDVVRLHEAILRFRQKILINKACYRNLRSAIT